MEALRNMMTEAQGERSESAGRRTATAGAPFELTRRKEANPFQSRAKAIRQDDHERDNPNKEPKAQAWVGDHSNLPIGS